MRLTRNATPSITPEGFIPGSTLDRRATPEMATRFAAGSYDSQARTVDAVFTTGARVRRWGIFEELAVTADAVDLGRVEAGQVRLLDSHRQDSVDDVLGVVESARFEGSSIVGRIRFSDTARGREAEARVAAGDLTGVSIGYRVSTWTMARVENDVEIWRADRWELLEVSLVAVPADPAARTRAAAQPEQTPTTETDDMRRNAPTGAEPATPVTTPATIPVADPAASRAAAPAPPPVDAAAIRAAERARVTEITDLGARHNIPAETVRAAVDAGDTLDQFRVRAFDTLAARQTPTSHIRVERDETETRRAAMEQHVTRALAVTPPQGEVPEAVRAYAGFNLVDLAAERLGERRVPSSFGEREDLMRRAMHTTSDFPILMENAVNRNLAASYDLAPQTYREIAVREDFNDFRPHDTVTVGDFPMLQPIAEAGKIQFGTVGEKKETVAVVPYAVGLAISRQLMVNDNLGAMGRVIARYGEMVALFEEKTFYAMKAVNSGAGPTLLEGNAAMFAAARGNLAGTGTAITVAAIGAARAAMRGYRCVPAKAGDPGAELLYNAPRILLVGPAKETEAELLLTSITPSSTANAVPASMRSLRPVVSQMIAGNAWELFTETNVRANFRWGLLNGYAAPRVRIDEPFGSQGVQLSVEHDFGCGGIEWRAAYRNPGN